MDADVDAGVDARGSEVAEVETAAGTAGRERRKALAWETEQNNY